MATTLKLRQAFREGVKRLCVRRIWTRVEKECRARLATMVTDVPSLLQGETKNQSNGERKGPNESDLIAAVLDLERSQLYSFQKGAVGFDTFFVVMSALDLKYEKFDPAPELSERVHAGYEAAVYCYLTAANEGKVDYPSPGTYFAKADFAVMMWLFEEPLFQDIAAATKTSVADSDWASLADAINRRPRGERVDGARLKHLYCSWGDALLKVRCSVPYRCRAIAP